MNDRFKNNKLTVIIAVILVLFFIEVIIFQIITASKFRDLRYHNHDIDKGCIVAVNDLINKETGLYDLSDEYSIKFENFSLVGANTVIDALVINKSGVDLSGIRFYIYSKMLTPEGKKHDGYRFIKADFSNDGICVDWKQLSADDIDIVIKSGTAKKIKIVINNHLVSKDEILTIHGSSQYILYKSGDM